MKILSMTAQKPNSTGSGVYLTEFVKAFAEMGHEQAVVAGIYEDENPEFPEGVEFCPVHFDTEHLPFPITGMSDEMPYRSTRYCDMTPEMVEQFKRAFLAVIEPLVERFDPDVILCHHLYLLTSIVRERYPDRKIYGFCHNTELRQLQKHGLERDFIVEQVRTLDEIFVPQGAQRDGVLRLYDMDPAKIHVLGMGYNNKVFRRTGEKIDDGVTRIVFAGKIAEKKGVMSLIRSLHYLPCRKDELEIYLAGGAGNEEEYAEICRLAEEAPYDIQFLGKLDQARLAEIYNRCDIFVLPSFFEGLPLTVIEALACGDRVVMTELPGIPEWLSEYVVGGDIRYVPLPEMRNTDEPVPETLPAFEQRLAETLLSSIRMTERKFADVSRISWENMAHVVLGK